MNKVYNDLKNKIYKNEELKNNLDVFYNELYNVFNNHAACRIMFSYTLVQDIYNENKDKYSSKIVNYYNSIVSVLNKMKNLDNKSKTDNLISKILDIRTDLIDDMENISKYADMLDIYQILFDKLSYKFIDEPYDIEYDGVELARKLLRQIFEEDNNVIINDNIKMLISHLPIRMTKEKYFSILESSMLEYKGINISSFERIIYLLRSEAMIPEKLERTGYFEDIFNLLEEFNSYEYKDISKEQLDSLSNKLNTVVITLEYDANMIVSFVEFINNAYNYVLTNRGINLDINLLNNNFEYVKTLFDEFIDIKDNNYDYILIKLEGVQEELVENQMYLTALSYDINNMHEEEIEKLGYKHYIKEINLIENQFSENLFIDIEEEVKDYVITNDDIIIKLDKFVKDSKALFEKVDRQVIRIIMSKVLGGLPVFFESHTELMDYVVNALTKVNKKHEIMEVINTLDSLEF